MRTIISLLTALFLFVSTTTSAVLLEGKIDFTGLSTTTDNGSAVTSLMFSTFEIDAVTGDFIPAVTPGDTVIFSDLATIVPTNDLWHIGGFEFDLAAITINTIVGSVAIVEGAGFLSKAGYETTPYNWAYSSRRGNNSFSATVSPAPPSIIRTRSSFPPTVVPAPAGAALLGLAILGFGFTRRNNQVQHN
ncbi:MULTISPECIES: hypothetical protein [unclassified Moritella]|uniref:hypothetical protein n=1 Tax=unclassified Moritella TaxID=2637987 RepID=UPI001BA69672|nr:MULTISPECIES: hypothetical protein [unclassified Moritella]QUM85362.1 hypothetical protein HWV02_13025 [Moritella sp. 28]QUM89594.1 hypothetical protein HWV03_12660 [Moritella sp. 36]